MEGPAFSWWMTTMLHTFPESLAYDQKLQDMNLAYLFFSERALGSLVENYVGCRFDGWGALRWLSVETMTLSGLAYRNA